MNPNELEFSGKLSDFHLVEVIQFLSLSRKSGELEILDGQRGPVGAVFLSEGDLVHAVMNGSRGVAAFDHILAVSEGFFNFVADRAMPERTVDQPTPALLLHAHHRQDELRRLRALLPADDCVLAIRPDVDPVPPLDTRQWQVLSWVDGRRTLARICQKLDDDLAARQTLLELIGLRLVTPCSAESPLLAIIPLPRPAHTIAGERVYPPRLRTNLLVKSIDGRATVRELGARLNMGPGELAEDLRLLRELQWITFSPADDKVFAGLLLESGG